MVKLSNIKIDKTTEYGNYLTCIVHTQTLALIKFVSFNSSTPQTQNQLHILANYVTLEDFATAKSDKFFIGALAKSLC
jgi:hypothetical protein